MKTPALFVRLFKAAPAPGAPLSGDGGAALARAEEGRSQAPGEPIGAGDKFERPATLAVAAQNGGIGDRLPAATVAASPVEDISVDAATATATQSGRFLRLGALIGVGTLLAAAALTGLGVGLGIGLSHGGPSTPGHVAAAFGALDGTVKGLQPSLHLAACSYPAPGAADGLSFVPQRGVTYALISAATHQAVTAGKTTVSGEADLNLAPLHSTLDQLFTFHGVGNSGSTLSYQLRSYQTGGHLAAGNSTSGLTLSVPGGAGLTWQVLPSVSGDFVLRADGQRCLEVESPNQQVIRLLPIKKGMTNTGNWNAALTHIKPTWTYNWGTSTQNDVSKIEFVPMIWGLWMNGTTLTKTVATLKEQGARHVLTYNEPDNASQSNVAVKAAANSWTHLVAGGLPLGSPATVSAVDPWMQTFMAKVPHSDVQFVTVHWYGGPSAQSLVDGLKEVHALYKLPIWITEFAPADWHAKVPGDIAFSQDQVAGFVQELLPKLDLLPFVQRYAWFEGGESDAALGHSTLLDAEGNMTPAGKIYGAYPLPPV